MASETMSSGVVSGVGEFCDLLGDGVVTSHERAGQAHSSLMPFLNG